MSRLWEKARKAIVLEGKQQQPDAEVSTGAGAAGYRHYLQAKANGQIAAAVMENNAAAQAAAMLDDAAARQRQEDGSYQLAEFIEPENPEQVEMVDDINDTVSSLV